MTDLTTAIGAFLHRMETAKRCFEAGHMDDGFCLACTDAGEAEIAAARRLAAETFHAGQLERITEMVEMGFITEDNGARRRLAADERLKRAITA